MSETHAQKAYDHLRSKLIAGSFLPGSRVRYGPIGKELGISATPVREAIGKLANEGFVQLVPQLGAVVRQVSREELIELYEIRDALEPYAVARAAERIGKQQLDEIFKHLDRMNSLTQRVQQLAGKTVGKRIVRKFEQADLAFHMLIIEATGNQAMVRTVGNSHMLTRIFSMDRHTYDAGVMEATYDDHLRIFTALKLGKPDMARDSMSTHIRNSVQRTLEIKSNPANRWWETT